MTHIDAAIGSLVLVSMLTMGCAGRNSDNAADDGGSVEVGGRDTDTSSADLSTAPCDELTTVEACESRGCVAHNPGNLGFWEYDSDCAQIADRIVCLAAPEGALGGDDGMHAHWRERDDGVFEVWYIGVNSIFLDDHPVWNDCDTKPTRACFCIDDWIASGATCRDHTTQQACEAAGCIAQPVTDFQSFEGVCTLVDQPIVCLTQPPPVGPSTAFWHNAGRVSTAFRADVGELAEHDLDEWKSCDAEHGDVSDCL